MPKRTDLDSVLVIGSGPIVIGQAAEFDYSGTQACRVLRAEGLRIVLVNSNLATIMTDPEMADATYIEPITPAMVTKIIERERPSALVATLGGQTALNIAVALADGGVLDEYGVELIGAGVDAIRAGEDRDRFKRVVAGIGGDSARSVICHSLAECVASVPAIGGYPVVVRPSFTMGGAGSGFAHDEAELVRMAGRGLRLSPSGEVLLEESVRGWKEYELELMRDNADNVVVVCSIENVDPIGVHTGDSITVAPAMTLTDQEYQRMRNMAIAVIRAVGVTAGGCNIQFAVDPATGRMIVIEMNPRVSRSSALASKATGFPIAKIAAKLAIGYTLDEITNDATQATAVAFEPALDYVAVKVPRFAFNKFTTADARLTTTMKSVGETLALGRCFTEALQKALHSLEDSGRALSWTDEPGDRETLVRRASAPTDGRINTVLAAIRAGATCAELATATGIDPWFLDQLVLLNEIAAKVAVANSLDAELLRRAKRAGFSDLQLGQLRGVPAEDLRRLRDTLGVRPVYKAVDTCAAEFAATTSYYYSTYDEESEIEPVAAPAVIILGSGPNRIGQGIEFDYSCVHASLALRAAGFRTVMVNCNPETVSTDYDVSDRLYCEPLTLEHVLEVVAAERAAGPVLGVLVQFGGQTLLRLAAHLAQAGVPVLGTSPEAIQLAEDRGAFGEVLDRAGLPSPEYGVAFSVDEATAVAARIGYPVLVRPSYVLGGSGMEVAHDERTLAQFIGRAKGISPDRPVLVDRFLEDAVEIDVDALYDGEELYLAGVMEQVEPAGVHSGDSACVLPPITLTSADVARLREYTEIIAAEVGVLGLLNIQYAMSGSTLYVLEANPRASRTVPFVSKATAVPLAKAAARICVGATIAELRAEGMLPLTGDAATTPAESPVAVKEVVLPWSRFRDEHDVTAHVTLGPEMRSTGEVMGIDTAFGPAFAKAQAATSLALPVHGRILVSVRDRDVMAAAVPLRTLAALGFRITMVRPPEPRWDLFRQGGDVDVVGTGMAPETLVADGEVDLVVSVAHDARTRQADFVLRAACVVYGVPCVTTVEALLAAVHAIEATHRAPISVLSLQEHNERLTAGRRPSARGPAQDGPAVSVTSDTASAPRTVPIR